MKYILTQEKLDKFVEKYMEITYPVLSIETDEVGDHYINQSNGKSVFLVDQNYVYFDGFVMYDVAEMFNVEKTKDVLPGMGNWIEKKYGIKGKGLF